MTPVFRARQRAEEFDAAVASPHAGLRDARYADLVELVGALREVPGTDPRAEPRPEFVGSLREQLMAAAETDLVAAPAPARTRSLEPPVRTPARERRVAAALGGLAIVGATASMSVAAQTSLPGDTLYPLKRVIEDVHAGVQRDAEDKGTTLLGNASDRLHEVDELTRESDDQDSRVIAETLSDFTDQATEASGLLLDEYAASGQGTTIAELRTFTADSLAALQRLQTAVPADARASLIEAAQVLKQIDLEAVGACPSCADLPLVTGSLVAGETPGLTPLVEDLLAGATTVSASSKLPREKGTERPSGDEPGEAGAVEDLRQGVEDALNTEQPTEQPEPQDPAVRDDKPGGLTKGLRKGLETGLGAGSGKVLENLIQLPLQALEDVLGDPSGR